MNLSLERRWFFRKSTIGLLSVDGEFSCYTLELPPRFNGELNVRKKTCIPEGVYPVIWAYSPKHQRELPLLQHIYHRDEVEIHILNTPDETEGCIGVGQMWAPDWIGHSEDALNALLPKIKKAWDAKEPVEISVFRTPEPISTD